MNYLTPPSPAPFEAGGRGPGVHLNVKLEVQTSIWQGHNFNLQIMLETLSSFYEFIAVLKDATLWRERCQIDIFRFVTLHKYFWAK